MDRRYIKTRVRRSKVITPIIKEDVADKILREVGEEFEKQGLSLPPTLQLFSNVLVKRIMANLG